MVPALVYIVASLSLVSSLSLVGVLFFAIHRDRLVSVLRYLVSFAAGTLFGGTFLHVLPEHAAEHGFDATTGLLVTVGILLAFAIERFVFWHHHHRPHDPRSGTLPYMILSGDGVHNVIDGTIIATSYLVSVDHGVATTVAIADHEIPQELSDFGVLLYGGFSRTKALAYNLLTALMAFVGAGATLALATSVDAVTYVAISIAAGYFVYIAGSDLVPEFKDEPDRKRSAHQFTTFLVGVGLLYLLAV